MAVGGFQIMAITGLQSAKFADEILAAGHRDIEGSALTVLCRDLNIGQDSVTCDEHTADVAILLTAGRSQLHIHLLTDTRHQRCRVVAVWVERHSSVYLHIPRERGDMVSRKAAFIILGTQFFYVHLDFQRA